MKVPHFKCTELFGYRFPQALPVTPLHFSSTKTVLTKLLRFFALLGVSKALQAGWMWAVGTSRTIWASCGKPHKGTEQRMNGSQNEL